MELLGLIASLNSPNGRYNQPLAAYQPLPPTSPPPTHPQIIRATHNIKVTVKNVAHNPAVLAN